MGKSFYGLDQIDHLITLGSPHLNQGGVQRGAHMARWIERHVPGATYSPQVRYTSVAGKYILGNARGKPFERFAHKTYKEICSVGDTWGDGITPISSALLPGSNQITLSDVSHYALFGEPWYGSEEIIPLWWRKSVT